MYMIFLLALLPDRNTSPHCWPNIHNRVVFLKLDAKILSKVSSLLLVDKEWSGGDLRELIYDRVLNAFFPTIHLGNEWLEEFLIDFILCSPPCWFCTYKITRTSYTSHWWTDFDTLETVLDTATNFGWFLATILDIFGHFWTFLTIAGQFENGHISDYLLLKKSTILDYFWPLWGHNWKGHKFRTLLGNKCCLWTLWGQKLLKVVLTVQHYYWFRPLQYQYLAKNLN